MLVNTDDRVCFFARTNYRNRRHPVGIRQADRRAHMYVIGKTGTGKTTLLETMAVQDIRDGQGVAVLDPHGDLTERLRAAIPDGRQADLIDFNVPNPGQSVGFNPLASLPPVQRPLAAAGMLEVFKKLWPDSWGPRTEHVLRNTLLALYDQPEATLADIPRLFDEADFRKRVVGRVTNAQVRRFWLQEFESYPARFRAEVIAPVQNKVGAFLTDPVLQRILTTRRSLDLRAVMDQGHILLVNLSKGQLGDDTTGLLGSLLVSKLGLAGLSRANVSEETRRDFFVYLDEFHSFTTLSLAGMLSELRKYRVNLVLAHQYLGQLAEPIRDAVLGNVGTMVCFRVGMADAELLEAEFRPEFSAGDLARLPNYQVYLRLMAKGVVSSPFSAETVTGAK